MKHRPPPCNPTAPFLISAVKLELTDNETTHTADMCLVCQSKMSTVRG